MSGEDRRAEFQFEEVDAALDVKIICPGCGHVLESVSKITLRCTESTCEYYSAMFVRPTIRLQYTKLNLP
jgi:hypothetical protein